MVTNPQRNLIIDPARPTFDPAMLSKRSRIMMYFEDLFKQMRQYQHDYLTTWTAVSRKPLTKMEMQSGNAIAMYDVAESKEDQMQFKLCQLSVFFEFYHQMAMGEHASDELARMLTDVQRAVMADVSCGGLTLNITEKRNQQDVDGPLEKLVTGVVEFTVMYRHAINDPRR
jgi:hypothetical protein